jgi:drug/metabolite transporter (DMT)-like permease
MLGVGLVILACALWALDTLVRYPLIGDGVSSLDIVFYEHAILTTIFSVVFFKSIKDIYKVKPIHLFYFFIVGAIGSALATLAFTQAFTVLNPSIVILLQKFQPVVAILLARVVLGETVKKEFIFWAAVSLFGALLISFEDILKLAETEASFQELFFHQGAAQGYVLVVFSIIGWGASTVFGKKLETLGYSNEQIMGGRFITGFLVLIPLILGSASVFTHDLVVFSKITLMVIVSGLLAMYLFYQGLRKISARACSLAEMFFPFMAVIVNWLVLGTALTPVQIVGGCFLLLGSVIIQIRHY